MQELVELTLEELAAMPVTSVSRRAERLAQAPASIYVISSDDIRRSGSATLAEALRLAPNLQVAQVGGRTYAISSRGFNNAIANKLLVLVDGRAVYSPVFSGVFWDQQDVVLEDVERIEVVSGPGATQWGANAVNGVINVITKPASATGGTLVAGLAGGAVDSVVARHGDAVGPMRYRLYAKAVDVAGTERANGAPLNDAWRRRQAGARVDWDVAGGDITLLADAYEGKVRVGTPLGSPSFSGASVLGRYGRRFEDESELRLQAYVDQAERDDLIVFRDEMRLVDFEAQYAARWNDHSVVMGGGHRVARDRAERTALVAFIPGERDLRWTNAFVMDTFEVGERLEATLGIKLERNVYTGWETLPSVRLAWKPDERQLVWGALSRAVRAPARLDREFFFPGSPPFAIRGGPDFVSEVANVAELGYRVATRTITFSATAFHGSYDRLRSGQPAPASIENGIEGESRGLEMWGSWQASGSTRISAGAFLLDQDLRLKPGSTDPTGPPALGNDPRYQWMLRASTSLARGVDVDVAIRRVGPLPNPVVAGYTAVDARIAWRPGPGMEISAGVRNAFDPGHPEFNAAATASQIPRAAYLGFAWSP